MKVQRSGGSCERTNPVSAKDKSGGVALQHQNGASQHGQQSQTKLHMSHTHRNALSTTLACHRHGHRHTEIYAVYVSHTYVPEQFLPMRQRPQGGLNRPLPLYRPQAVQRATLCAACSTQSVGSEQVDQKCETAQGGSRIPGSMQLCLSSFLSAASFVCVHQQTPHAKLTS